MRHRVVGRRLSRTAAHRKAMLRNLAQSLFEHGQVETTLPKAKELVRFIEPIITLAKKNTLAARRLVISRCVIGSWLIQRIWTCCLMTA